MLIGECFSFDIETRKLLFSKIIVLFAPVLNPFF